MVHHHYNLRLQNYKKKMSRLYLTNNFEFKIKHRLFKENFCEPGTQDVPLFHKYFLFDSLI
jgi:hypothetical protein